MIDFLFNIVDLITTALAFEWVRIPLAILLGYLVARLFKQRGTIYVNTGRDINWREVIAAAASVLIYFGLGWSIRWYKCPIDTPLFCKCCDPVNLLALFGHDAIVPLLAQDYVIYWSIFIGLVAVMGIIGLVILWKIYKK